MSSERFIPGFQQEDYEDMLDIKQNINNLQLALNGYKEVDDRVSNRLSGCELNIHKTSIFSRINSG